MFYLLVTSVVDRTYFFNFLLSVIQFNVMSCGSSLGTKRDKEVRILLLNFLQNETYS